MKRMLPLLLCLSACSADPEAKLETLRAELEQVTTLEELAAIAEQRDLACEVKLECLNQCQSSFAEKFPDAQIAPDEEVTCWWVEEKYPWTIVWGGVRVIGYSKDGEIIEKHLQTSYTGP